MWKVERCSGSTYLVPLTHGVSSTILEQLLVVRNAVFAVDEAVAEGCLAIVLGGRNEAIPGSSTEYRPVWTGSPRLGREARRGLESN